MAITAAINLANGTILTTSSAIAYTAPTTVVNVTVDQARLVNYGTVAVTVDVWMLQSGDSEADAFLAISQKRLSPDETYLCPELIGDSINAGGTIKVKADTATSVSFSATGTERTS